MARNNYNIESIDGNNYKSITITIVVVLAIAVLFYLLSVYITNKPDKVRITEGTISYEQISAGSTFTMSDKKYLVIFYNRDNGGDITTSYNMNKFYFIKMSIKEEYARIIDNYFNMYGYKVNTLKVPNITGRQNWNYVKTIGCNIVGDIPQTHLQEIKEMFDSGITLWHNTSNFLDYSQSNNIV